jgi:uncharacterized protein
VQFVFEWDSTKAKENFGKHGISFDHAAEVFLDPFMLSIYDEGHSATEDRWITMGKDRHETVLVVAHTFREIDADNCGIRLISARRATRQEEAHYAVT